jgi:hypothetical protein
MARVSTLLQYEAGNEIFMAEEAEPPQLWVVYAKSVTTPPNKVPAAVTEENLKPEAHLAYLFRFKFVYTGKASAHVIIPPMNVLVDASTGAVVGRG